ncbi:MAG: amidohydrolase family protein [Acidobacteria bacterium]|nr:amidohydrolase family protein [Acidobacteriota bacterium]
MQNGDGKIQRGSGALGCHVRGRYSASVSKHRVSSPVRGRRQETTAWCLPYLSVFLLLFARALPAQTPDVAFIRGATLIDGTGRPPVAGVAILIQGGRILRIDQQANLQPPAGAHVVEAAGKYIVPGLIDSHVHYDMPWLHRLYLANGVTTVRDLGSPMDRILTLRQEIAVGNILGPRLFVSGTPINPASVKALCLSGSREMASRLVAAGVDGIKVTGYTPGELKDIAEVAHAAGLTVYGHTGPKKDRRGPGARLAVEAGLDGVEHALGVLEDSMGGDPEVPPDFDPSRRDHLFRYWYGRMHRQVNRSRMESLIELMVREHVYLAPTLVNFDRNFAKRNTPEMDADAALKYVPEDEPDVFGRFGPDEREEWRKTLNLMKEATYKFQKAGGLLIAGTDSPGAALPGWSLHQEMELFVQAGISPMEALQAATRNNARVLNREKELGTVEVGKYADLVILDANPIDDIRNTRRIHAVIREGRVLDPTALLAENLKQFGERGTRHFDRARIH